MAKPEPLPCVGCGRDMADTKAHLLYCDECALLDADLQEFDEFDLRDDAD